jgi:hypothetical protein
MRPEPDEGPIFRFVLVSMVRGRCPWLSVRVGGWEPTGAAMQVSGRRPGRLRGRCNRRLSTDGHGRGPRGARSGFACGAAPGAAPGTRVGRLAIARCVPRGRRRACVPTCCPDGAWGVDVRDYAGRRRPGGLGPGWLRRVARAAALRNVAAWHASRAERPAVAGAAPRCSLSGWPAGSACLRGCPGA